MKLATVAAIVERDRALEILRSRHALLRRAAALYMRASRSLYPSPAAHSVEAFEHLIVQALASAGRLGAERQALALAFEIIEAAAFEYLAVLSPRRRSYELALAPMTAEHRSQRGHLAPADIDRLLLAEAVAFEHARTTCLQAPTSFDAAWLELEALTASTERLRRVLRSMDSVISSAARQAQRQRARRLAWALRWIAATAGVAAVLLFTRLAWAG